MMTARDTQTMKQINKLPFYRLIPQTRKGEMEVRLRVELCTNRFHHRSGIGWASSLGKSCLDTLSLEISI